MSEKRPQDLCQRPDSRPWDVPCRQIGQSLQLVGTFLATESDEKFDPFEESNKRTAKNGNSNDDTGVCIHTRRVHFAQEDQKGHDQGGR